MTKKMTFLIFILFTSVLADYSSSEEDSPSKYIDLLSNDEKKEFLERVARRIIKEVESRERDDVQSGEIPDAMLKEHDNFVKSVLQEETKSYKTDEKSQSNETKSQAYLKRKPLEASIDGENSSLSNSHLQPPNPYIQVEIVTDKNEDKAHVGLKEIVSENVENAVSRDSTSPEADATATISHKSNENITFKSKISRREISQEKDEKLNSSENFSSNNNSTHKETLQAKNSTESETTREIKKGPKKLKALNIPSKLITKEQFLEDTTDIVPKFSSSNQRKPISSYENNNYTIKKIKKNINVIKNSEWRNDEYLNKNNTRLRALELNGSESKELTKGYNDTKTSNTNNNPERNTIILISAEEASQSESPTKNYLGGNNNNPINTTNGVIDKPSVRSKKNRFKVVKSKESNKKEKDTPIIINIKPTSFKINKKPQGDNTYHVYEISPNEPAFVSKLNNKVQSKLKNQSDENLTDHERPGGDNSIRHPPKSSASNQPYLIPVYNYSPQKAYYNPTNRLGPNYAHFHFEDDTDEKDNVEVYTNKHFNNPYLEIKQDNHKKYLKESKDSYSNQMNNNQYSHVMQRFPYVEQYDNVDVDNRGRKSYYLPDPGDEIYSLYAMRNAHLKDYLNSIRNEEYNNKISKLHSNDDMKKNKETRNTKKYTMKISMDYLGEMERKNKKYNEKRDNLFVLKPKNNDFGTVTPHPYTQRNIYDSIRSSMEPILRLRSRNKSKKTVKEDTNQKFDTISDILRLTDEKDVFDILYRLQKMNLKLERSNGEIHLDVYINALRDMLIRSSEDLKNYDYLKTAVDIQAGLQKLIFLVEGVQNSMKIHPADAELLKYMMFLHDLGSEVMRTKSLRANPTNTRPKIRSILPRNYRKDKPSFWAPSQWLRFKPQATDKVPVEENPALLGFLGFLNDVEDGVYELHESIKAIASSTTYTRQDWFSDLSKSYFKTDKKHLLQLLLHISVSQLFDSVEKSSGNGLEGGFINYMKKNRKDAKRALEEFVFVMTVLKELKAVERFLSSK